MGRYVSPRCDAIRAKEHTSMVVNLKFPERLIPPIVSVDDHVIEPPDLWQRWLPARFRDAGPKVVEAPYVLRQNDGGTYVSRSESGPLTDFWAYEDRSIAIPGASIPLALPPDPATHHPVRSLNIRP